MSAATRTLLAPAKLNLGLRVIGRRPDGYHLIESLFVPIDLADEVTVSCAESARAGVAFELLGEDGLGSVPADATNLAAEAARRFLADAGFDRAVELTLRKRIPAGAGLGGGSSDAGAVLRALSQACGVPAASLSELALGLGADVPYFLDPLPYHLATPQNYSVPATSATRAQTGGAKAAFSSASWAATALGNKPNTVAPLPDIPIASAPRSPSRSRNVAIRGQSRTAAGSKSLTSNSSSPPESALGSP